MKPDALISVILSTYNRPDALGMVLRGLDQQTDHGFEVVVADDGSGEETRRLIELLRAEVHYPLIHAWHEDRGFRAAEARNLAVSRSRGEYLVFLDGDCVPPPDFIATHRRLAEDGFLVRGNRIMLSERLTGRVLQENTPIHAWGLLHWLGMRLRGGVNRFIPMIRLGDGRWRKRLGTEWRGVKTCNLGVWRKDFEAVDGLDEAYTGWGHEDADLAIRLFRYGVRRKEGTFALPVFHLWHRINDRSTLADNEARLEDTLRSDHVRAHRGLHHHETGADQSPVKE